VTFLLEPDSVASQSLLGVLGSNTQVVTSAEALRWSLRDDTHTSAIVVGPTVDLDTALSTADSVRLTRPDISVILVRRRVETTVMAEALRAGVREVVNEREPSDLRDAVRRASELASAVRHTTAGAEHAQGQAPRTAGHVVTVFSAKGGAGKTTSSINLAAQLAAGGRRSVCLVDLDLAFGDVGVALRLKPQHTIADAIAMGDDLDSVGIKEMLTQHSPGLSVLLAPTEPAVAEAVSPQITSSVLEELRREFDYVLIDTPPSFTEHVLAAFDVSDLIVLIATMDVPTLKNLKLTLETLDVLQYPKERWRLLLNRADEKVGLSVADVEKVLGTRVNAQIPMSREVPAAVNRGVAISLEHPNHAVAQAYKRFVDTQILPATGGEVAAPAPAAATVPARQTKAATDRRRWFARRKALAS